MTAYVEGSWTLEEQELSLNDHQQLYNTRLTSFTKDGNGTRNVAVFVPVPLGKDVPALKLVIVAPGQSPRSVQPPDTTLTSASQAYVSSTIEHVATFHDR